MRATTIRTLLAALAGVSGLFTQRAAAHIDVVGAVESRNGDMKAGPCEGVARGANGVFAFEPGAIVTLSINEGIPHPGYFRIAFDDSGEDAFKEPASIDPVDPSRACPYQGSAATDKCGSADFCNVTSTSGGATVLWDNIDPHVSGGGMRSFTIKLPDVECENCTIQILQIMEDTVHGGYCPKGVCTELLYIEDIYHRCIDITLKRGVGMTPGTVAGPVKVNGLDCVAMAGGQDAGTPIVSNDGGAPVAVSDAGHDPGGHGDASTMGGDAAVSAPAPDSGVVVVTADGGAVVTPVQPSSADDGGCSVGNVGEERTGALVFALGSLLGAALVLRRRRRS